MYKITLNILILLIIGPLFASTLAQQRSGKKMQQQMYSREYDTSAVETLEGEVTDINFQNSKRNTKMQGVHITLKTDSETIPVHLGPAWFIEQQESFKKGDVITVTGSRITYNEKPALIAAEIKRNEMTLQLRNQQGFPVWRGWRMGNRNQ